MGSEHEQESVHRSGRVDRRAEHVALVGLRAAGKTAVGRRLARRLGRSFVDLDDDVARAAGRPSAGAVLEEEGEPAFREREARALAARLAEDAPLVLATGGGAVLRPESRALLAARAFCVWLDADVAILRERLAADRAPRPPLLAAESSAGPDAALELEELARQRAPLYRAVAALRVDAASGEPDEVAESVARALLGR